MKITSMRYDGVEDPFVRVEVSLMKDGKFHHGYVLVEIEGRDVEYEGDLAKLNFNELNDLFTNDDFLAIYQRGYEEWNELSLERA